MSLVVVQAVSAQATSSATSITSPSFDSTGGNLLVVNGTDDVPASGCSVSDNKSNTWSVGVAYINFNVSIGFTQRYAASIIGGTGHTVTFNLGTTGLPTICVVEISGADSNPLDQVASGTNSGTGNPHLTAQTPTTTQADAICIAGLSHSGTANQTFSSNNGYTVQTSQTNTSWMPGVLSTLIISTIGQQQESYNFSPNTGTPAHAAGIGTYMALAPAAPSDSAPEEGLARSSPMAGTRAGE